MAGTTGMISYLQRIAGLLLTGDISVQELFVFWGSGANGKSVCCDTICGMMGDYAGLAPPALLTNNRLGGGEHPTEIADLDGRRAIVGSESEEGATLKIQLVKRLTGDATLKGRFMRQDYFEFPRTFKLILATNNKPRILENTNAVWRRLRLIPFNVVIPPAEQDPKLLDKLRTEWPGILAWAVRGCLDWQKNGMQTPSEVLVATADYQTEQDVLTEYITARCSTGEKVKVSRTELFSSYQSWAVQSGERHPLERNAFFDRIRRLKGVSEKQWRPVGQTTPVRGFVGIGLQFNGSEGSHDETTA
jgi:putative DNA primase/helicase